MAEASLPHLPPGREPGPQTLRNRKQLSFWEPVCAVVGAAMFLAGVYVAAGGRGPQFDRSEEAIGGTIFALGGLLCVYGAYVMRRRRRPARPARLRGAHLAVDRDDVRRGDQVSVNLTFPSDAQGLELGLVCVERYDHRVHVQTRGQITVIRQTAETTVHEQWRPAQPETMTFEIPRDAPYSWEGECVSFAWRVSARAGRRLRRDPRLDRAIWVRW